MSATDTGNSPDLGAQSATPALPPYDPVELAALDPDALIERLVEGEDRAPSALIHECASRGEAMIDRLAVLVEQGRSWNDEGTNGEWWLRLHAVMVLGLIPGERAGLMLVSFMRRMERAQDEELQDWLSGYWPALFRNKPETVVPALRNLAHDRAVDWYMRANAVESVIAAGALGGAEPLDAELDWAARIAADESEDWSMRLCTASDLLDYPRERHRALLDGLAARQGRDDRQFTKAEVAEAFAAGADDPQWRRFDNPWKFYEPAAIAERQERWAREDAEALDDEYDEELEEPMRPYVRPIAKIGRNDPCPCGSGKKYKKCCLPETEE